MRNFPLRSTRSERLFAFSASALSLFPLGANFPDGYSLDLANTLDNRLFSSCDDSSGRHIGGHLGLHAITAHLSSFPFKTTLCRMLGLIGLVAFAEIHFRGFIGFGKCRQH